MSFRIMLYALNILVRAVHIPGHLNTLPDLLSRFQVDEFHRLAPHMDLRPTEITLEIKEQYHL